MLINNLGRISYSTHDALLLLAWENIWGPILILGGPQEESSIILLRKSKADLAAGNISVLAWPEDLLSPSLFLALSLTITCSMPNSQKLYVMR